MESKIQSYLKSNDYARLVIVSRHLCTTVPSTYAVKKELQLPGSDTFVSLRESRTTIYSVAFMDNLQKEQRNYFMPLDLFHWPTKIYFLTNEMRAFLSNSGIGIDIVITSREVPSKLLMMIEYDFSKPVGRLPKIYDSPTNLLQDFNPKSKEESEEELEEEIEVEEEEEEEEES